MSQEKHSTAIIFVCTTSDIILQPKNVLIYLFYSLEMCFGENS